MNRPLGDRSILYTVIGRWQGVVVEVTWDGRGFNGPEPLTATITKGVNASASLTDALGAIGRSLDEVLSLCVDDGEQPWDFDARPMRPASELRRRQMFRDKHEPDAPQTA